jgi:hypothetical protein
LNILQENAEDLYEVYYAPLDVVTSDNVNSFEPHDFAIAPKGWKVPQ